MQRRNASLGTAVARMFARALAANVAARDNPPIQIRVRDLRLRMQPRPTDSLVPQLREAELKLQQAIAAACSTKPPGRANTGELIRIEELLQLASDATKRAIAIRRRRRLDKAQRTERAALADAEAAAGPGTAHRAFTDARRVTWDVFAVYPVVRPPPHAQLRGTFRQGWLCFDSTVEKRRLSPIPRNWQSLSDRELEELSRHAEVAPIRRRRPGHEPEDTPSRDA
jgi:hypothetical protein